MKKISLCLVALTIAMVSCEPNIEKPIAVAPTVLTKSVTEITESTADVVGEVAADGGTEVTERGVCWNTDGAPTILDYRVKDTAVGLGTFTSKLSDLKANTTYYVRAYATNAVGTSYGEEKSFTTKEKVNTDTPDTPDTPDSPEGVISCAEALAICKATGTTSTTETFTIRGYVTEFKETFNTQYGDVTYWMADEQGGGKVLLAYRVKPVKTSDQAVKVNDYVEVVGTLVNYHGNTPEVNAAGTYTIIPEQPVDKTQIIKFQDENAKLICILHWDENEDGELSYEEAAAVTDLGTAFKNSRILAFTELEYFTGLTNIAKNDFIDCASLVSIYIPAQIISIDMDAFSGCTNLKKIYTSTLSGWCKINFGNSGANPLSKGGKLYINGVEQTDITIPSYITEIKDYTFYGCISLKSVTIGNRVTSIGVAAFNDCTSLTSVTIPNSVTSIDSSAFTKCTSLTSVNISDLSAWCKISFKAGYGGISINVSSNPLCHGAKLYINGVEQTDITIPSDISKIKDYTFNGCTSLKSVTIPNSVTSIGASAFYDCTSLTSVTIPDSVTSIGTYAFDECTSLKSVNISDLSAWCKIQFNKMASNPLYNEAKLYINGVEQTDITIPSDISKINAYAFYGCTSLKSVTIPNSVTSIGEEAFCNCTSLAKVYCKSTSAPKGGSYMFAYYGVIDGRFQYHYPKCKIYVPRNSVSAYESATYWKSYAESIEGYDF